VQAGAGNGGARGRAAGEGNRAGAEGERRVEVIPAGGGAVAAAAERWPEAKHCRWQEAEQRSTCSRKKKGGGPGDLFGNLRNLRDLSVN
jgi:hypothetical protein